MFQPRQHHLLACFLNLAGEENLVENRVDLVEVEDEVQFTNIPEELIEDLDKEVDGF